MRFFTARELREAGHSEYLRKQASQFGKIAMEDISHHNFSQILNESRDEYDIFLSHSFLDKELILGLKKKIEEIGFSVYVDWIDDTQLDRSCVTRDTAETLRNRMTCCKSLLYAFSDNSTKSVWMPWELGFMDGVRKNKVAVMQINEIASLNKVDYKNQEYLGLYYIVDAMKNNWGNMCLWVNSPEDNTYVEYRNWLNGEAPSEH